MNKKILIALLAIAGAAIIAGVMPANVKAATVDELQALIAQLQTQIQALQAQLQQVQGQEPVKWCHTFNTNLGIGSNGTEFETLQTALIKDGANGADLSYDSAGMGQSTKFGEYTASAVVAFQEKYASEVLKPYGLAHGTGYVGKSTRAKLNKLYGCNNGNGIGGGGGATSTCLALKQCPDGSFIRACGTPEPKCPEKLCAADVKQCPDGSYVSRKGFNCEFAQCPPITTKSITVLSPNGGETLTRGTAYTIRWTGNSDSSRVTIDTLNENGKAVADGLPAVLGNNEGLVWNIPSTIPIGKYKLKISICPVSFSDAQCTNADLTPYGYDISDNYFSITASTSPVTPPIATSTTQGSLSVSLASDNPMAQTILAGLLPSQYSIYGVQELTPVLKLNFTNNGYDSLKVTTLDFERKGLSSDSDFVRVALYDGNNFIANYTISYTGSDPGWKLYNSQGIFEVPAFGSKTITLKIKLVDSTIAGKTFSFNVSQIGAPLGTTMPADLSSLLGNTMTVARVTAGIDLEAKGTQKGSFDPYGFTTNFCVYGNKSINDLKKEISSLVNFPFAYNVFDTSGNKHYRYVGAEGGIEQIKNGTCNSLGWTIQPADQQYWNTTGKVEVVVDPNNLIKETNENNNTDQFITTSSLPAKSITVVSPNGGEKLVVGSTQTIRWSSSQNVSRISLDLVNSRGALVVKNLVNLTGNPGSASWMIPSYLQLGQYWMRVGTCNESVAECITSGAVDPVTFYDVSDAPFSIVAADIPSVIVVSPNGGEKVALDQTYSIKWNSTGVGKVGVLLIDYLPWGTRSSDITESLSNQGVLYWEVNQKTLDAIGGKIGDNYKIRVYEIKSDGTVGAQDDSDNYFNIAASSSVVAIYDTDNSPDYISAGFPSAITPQKYPDLFMKALGRGIYVGGNLTQKYIFGQGPDFSTPKPTDDDYDTFYDHCANATQLNEAYVTKDKKLSALGVNCPNGCSNGACNPLATTTSATP